MYLYIYIYVCVCVKGGNETKKTELFERLFISEIYVPVE
jgi:hypothetical protein